MLACPAIAVLPEEMSQERYDWLKKIGAEVHTTPGSESNVREVYDKTDQLLRDRPEEVVVLNQFEEFGNALWHYTCTGPANLLGTIKLIKYFEMDKDDIVFSVATDSMELYRSRLLEQRKLRGAYSENQAACDFDSCLQAVTTDHMLELSYWDKKRMHNLKYFTWVEQRGKDAAELDRQWYDSDYWTDKYNMHIEMG